MRILLTNDDGINAPGLKVLERIARKLTSDVWVVAPEQEQSGAAHSLTLHVPVRVRKITARRHAVSGTPTDCVLLALQQIIPARKPQGREAPLKKVDLVLSGVNRGSNVGDDISYSGTVAAAMEATLLGVPAIALSQALDDDQPICWDTASAFAQTLIPELLRAGWPAGSFINLNFPACTKAAVKGVTVSPQGKRVMSVALHLRSDPRGRPYFWIGGDRDNAANGPEVDVAKLEEGFVTVTPVQMDMTDYPTLNRLKGKLKA
ncbi:MAG: 5'/3'-nucleotidase SurE [Alphaproteobacteria bacterium]|nr:5'/3'-nucleotidase SurE [Alphaproteobacteria bacterium]